MTDWSINIVADRPTYPRRRDERPAAKTGPRVARGRRRVRLCRPEAAGRGPAPRAARGRAASSSRGTATPGASRSRGPQADRLEYLLELDVPHGPRGASSPDPTNPLTGARARSATKSVIEFPGYEPPEWVADEDAAAGLAARAAARERAAAHTVPALLWSAADTDPERPLPLLIVHDGPEYAHYSSLVRLLDHLVDFGEVPELRAALVPPPGDRNESYSASARYANALAADLVPGVLAQAPSNRPPVLLGASLGALAALHAHFRNPGVVRRPLPPVGQLLPAALRRARGQASRRFARITRFVGQVHGRRGFAPRDPDGDHVRHRRGEPRQQPRAGRRAAAARLGRAARSGTATRTTGSPGATRSILTSRSCCCARGREPPRPRARAGAADRVRPLGPAAARASRPSSASAGTGRTRA